MSTAHTVRLHRVIAAKPEKVNRAFLEPDARARWLPPNGFTGTVHHSDARVGGRYKMSFGNFTTGKSAPTPARAATSTGSISIARAAS